MTVTPRDFHYCNRWQLSRRGHPDYSRPPRSTLIRSNVFQVRHQQLGEVVDCVIAQTQSDRKFKHMVLGRVRGTNFGDPLDSVMQNLAGTAWYGWGAGHSIRSLCEVERPEDYWYYGNPGSEWRNHDWRWMQSSWWHIRLVLMAGLRLNGFETISPVAYSPDGGFGITLPGMPQVP